MKDFRKDLENTKLKKRKQEQEAIADNAQKVERFKKIDLFFKKELKSSIWDLLWRISKDSKLKLVTDTNYWSGGIIRRWSSFEFKLKDVVTVKIGRRTYSPSEKYGSRHYIRINGRDLLMGSSDDYSDAFCISNLENLLSSIEKVVVVKILKYFGPK